MSEIENFRREEDRKWRAAVDHQLVTVMTGHQVMDRRLAKIEEALSEIDNLLRGDPAEDRDGIVSQLHQIQTSLARLNAVIFVDSTGRKGLQYEVQALLTGEHQAEHRWKFFTAVVVAVISLGGLLLTNLDRIAPLLERPKKEIKMPVKKIVVRQVIRE